MRIVAPRGRRVNQNESRQLLVDPAPYNTVKNPIRETRARHFGRSEAGAQTSKPGQETTATAVHATQPSISTARTVAED